MADAGFTKSRPVVCGKSGAVASAHPLASLAGLDMLRSGGNAIDAAVTMAAALAVVEPYMSGPGGCGLSLLHRASGETLVLNFTGVAPAKATPDQFTHETHDKGPRSIMVPGNVAGWFEMLEKYGSRSPAQVFEPAIRLARDGFPLHHFNVAFLNFGLSILGATGKAIYDPIPKQLGAILQQPELAKSLEQLAQHGPRWFYEGDLGKQIADYLQKENGLITLADLAEYRPTWEEPIEVTYRGARVVTCPPNCEGFQILQTLKLLEAVKLGGMTHNSADYLHLVSEAAKLAIADRIKYGGDPKVVPVPVKMLLNDSYCAERRQKIVPKRASRSEGERWRAKSNPKSVTAGKADGMTTHLSAVDSAGNVVSITQSLGNVFGSGVMVPGTGVTLNNFCEYTEIDPKYPGPNMIAPGKRWSCCMSPVQVFQGDKFWFSISTPGSYGLLQTTVQMLLNIIDFSADPQAAIEAPRFRLMEDMRMQIESRVSLPVRNELTKRGHQLDLVGDWSPVVGGGQAVMVDPTSQARMGAADPRRDGYALAY